MTPRAHSELPTLLGRKRLRLGGRKGQHGENGTNSAERIKKHHQEKLEFPRPAEPRRAPSKVLTGNGWKLRLSQTLGRPWHEPGANLPAGLALSSRWWGDTAPVGRAAGGSHAPAACPAAQGCAGSAGMSAGPGQDQHRVPKLKMCRCDWCGSLAESFGVLAQPPRPPHRPREASAKKARSTGPPCPIPTCSLLSRV